MTSGIKIKDIEIGEGQEAKEDDWAFAEVHFYLNKGEEIHIYAGIPDHRVGINLKSRDVIPSLRHRIAGMPQGEINEEFLKRKTTSSCMQAITSSSAI